MLTTKKARRVLTKEQQRHLTEDADVHTVAAWERTRRAQRETGITCFACEAIERALSDE